MIDAWNLGTFLTILLLTFSIVLLITGAFTAYFGSGKSRKIGGGLLGGGLAIGVVWVLLARDGAPLGAFVPSVLAAILDGIGVMLAAALGGAAAIGLFLLAIMKS